MRVVVMGAGAIGSLFGGRLADQHEVTLVGRKPHVDAIQDHGLQLTGHTERTLPVDATTDPREAGAADAVLLTVKAYDTQQAIQDAGPLLDEHTYVVSLQNGLGNLETLAQHVPTERVMGATTSHGCLRRGPGHVEHTGLGDTALGPMEPPDLPAHHELAQALTEAGLETTVVARIQPRLWAKAAINAAINPLTAITGLPNGALLDLDALRSLLEETAQETEHVAAALGIDVEEGAWVQDAITVAKRTAKNRSSMLQDVERGRQTEIDAINGHIARVAEKHGVPAPRNRALHALVTGIEATLTYDG